MTARLSRACHGHRGGYRTSLSSHKTMAKDFSLLEHSNRSTNPSIHDVSNPARRIVLRGALGAEVRALQSNYHVPISNTGSGLLLLEKAA